MVTVAIQDSVPGVAKTSVRYDLTFSSAVTGLTASDFSIQGGTLSSLTGSGSSYSVTVNTQANSSGLLSFSLLEGAVTSSTQGVNAAQAAADQYFISSSGTLPASLDLGRNLYSNQDWYLTHGVTYSGKTYYVALPKSSSYGFINDGNVITSDQIGAYKLTLPTQTELRNFFINDLRLGSSSGNWLAQAADVWPAAYFWTSTPVASYYYSDYKAVYLSSSSTDSSYVFGTGYTYDDRGDAMLAYQLSVDTKLSAHLHNNQINEQSSNETTLTIFREGVITRTIQVPLTISGSASYGIDYEFDGNFQIVNGKIYVTLNSGESSTDLIVRALSDSFSEGNETISIRIDTTSYDYLSVASPLSLTILESGPTGTVTIGGTPTQGQVLTASNTLADVDGLGVISYQWLANGSAISGATGSTLTLGQDLVGKAISVRASYTDGFGTLESMTSSASQVANVNDAPTGSVSISGTPTQGQVLTASNTLDDADGLGDISYQWLADDSAISGATGSTLTLGQSLVGKAISVRASYTDDYGAVESLTSSASLAVTNINDAPTGFVTIEGVLRQGETLTASNTLADEDDLGPIVYQWLADGNIILGATESTLTLGQAQVGKAISVRASYTDGGGAAELVFSNATSIVAPVNSNPTGSVTISGTLAQGQVLTAGNTLADADNLGVIIYQWFADGQAIGGETQSTLTLTQLNVGQVISVRASYTDGNGTAEGMTSATTAVVANINDLPSGSVRISGTPTQGQVLTASNTLDDVDGLGDISYQWLADDSAISGATGSTLTLGQALVGKAIGVRASYTDGYGTLESMTSTATQAVANVNDAPTGSVSISGTLTQGEVLTASNTLADVDGLGAISYQWLADGNAIVGATESTLTLGQAQVGKAISVRASYTDGAGTVENIFSNSTELILGDSDLIEGSIVNRDYESFPDLVLVGGINNTYITGGIVKDLAGNIYVAGTTYGDWSNNLLIYQDNKTPFVTKLNAQGEEVWTRFFEDTLDSSQYGDYSVDIKLDGQGQIYLSTQKYVYKLYEDGTSNLLEAIFSPTQERGRGTVLETIPTNDGLIIFRSDNTRSMSYEAVRTASTLSSDGDYQDWFYLNQLSSSGMDNFAAGSNAQGNFLVASTLNYSPDGRLVNQTSDIEFSKYDQSGNLVWTFVDVRPGDQFARSVKLNSDESFYVLSSETAYLRADVLLSKYDSFGDLIWDKTISSSPLFGTGDLWDTGSTLDLDENGNIYIAGVSSGYLMNGIRNTLGSASDNVFVIKFNSDGEEQWTQFLDTGFYANRHSYDNSERRLDLVVVEEDLLFVSGHAQFDSDGQPTNRSPAFNHEYKTEDGFVAKVTGPQLVLSDGLEVVGEFKNGVREGDSVEITFKVSSRFAEKEIPYVISGVDSDDIAGMSLTGSVKVDWNGYASLDINITKDTRIENDVLALRANDQEIWIDIDDYVNTPPVGSVLVSGTPTQGQVLTASNTLADVDGLGAISYQWLANGSVISEATGLTLTLGQAQVGKAISVRASYTDGYGAFESVTSSADQVVSNVNDAPTGFVSISGIPTQGQVLTASNTLADADTLGAINYQWLANGSVISGAIGSTLTLGQALVGKVISVRASYVDGYGTFESVTSSSTAPIFNVNEDPTGSVLMSGTPIQGQVLVATNNFSDPDGINESTINYTWFANGIEIPGVKQHLLVLDKGLVGKVISVQANYIDNFGFASAVMGSSTSLIGSPSTTTPTSPAPKIPTAPTSPTIPTKPIAPAPTPPTPTTPTSFSAVDKVLDEDSLGYGLYQLKDKSYVLAASNLMVNDTPGLGAILLKSGSKNFTSKVEPSNLLVYADGTFGLIISSSNQKNWTEQKFTRDGLANGSSKKLSVDEVLSYEAFFNEDINGDGRFGKVILDVVDENLAHGLGLYQSTAGGLVVDEAGKSENDGVDESIALMVGNKPFMAANNAPVVLVKEDVNFAVITQSGSAWTKQRFDDEGMAIGKAVKLSNAQLLAKESLLGRDLNGNGSIGDSVANVFDDGLANDSAYGLYRTESGSLVIDDSGLSVADLMQSPITLMSGLKLFTSKALSVQLLVYDDGFGLITGSGKAWSEQKFSSEGLALGRATKLTLPQLLAKESEMGKDLNGSGSIGDSVSVVLDDGLDENSAYGLYRTESGALIIDSSGLFEGDQTENPLMLMSGSKLYNTKSTTVSLVSYDDGFGLITGSGKAWSEQKFSSEGLALGRATKLTLSQLLAKESEMGKDLNGNGSIGDSVSAVLDDGFEDGSLYGLYRTESGAMIIDDAGLGEGDLTQAPITLMSGKKAFSLKSSTVDLVVYDEGFGLITGSGNSWSEQLFNSEGLATGRAQKLNLLQLLQKEPIVSEDLDGDDLIGNVITQAMVSNNDLYLYKTKTNTFVFEDLDLNIDDTVTSDAIDLLASNKRPWTVKDGSLIEGLAQIDEQFVEVLIRTGSTYTAQKFDLETGSASGRVNKLNEESLEAREFAYEMDLNANGEVDLVGVVSPPLDWIF